MNVKFLGQVRNLAQRAKAMAPMPSAQEQLGLENLNPDPGDRLPFALDME
jgi:hypothetical protein